MRRRTIIQVFSLFLAFAIRGAQMISIDASGTNAGGSSVGERCLISADGRFAAFSSVGQSYVPGDVNGVSDVFLHDCLARSNIWDTTYSRVIPAGSIMGSMPLALSPDARFLLFESRATNHVHGWTITNNQYQLYLRDLHSNVTTLVTVATNGMEPANSGSPQPVGIASPARLTPDGRFVVFSSPATNMVYETDANGGADIFRRNLVNGTTELVTASPGGTSTLDRATMTFMASTNGRFVAFVTAATNVVSGLVNTSVFLQVYWRDMQGGASSPVSVNPDGALLQNGSSLLGLSSDGRYVCFSTLDSNVVAGVLDENHTQDYFIRDMTAGETWLVTKSTNGTTASSRSGPGQFSDNGDWFLFGNSSGEVVSGITNHPASGFNLFAHHLPSRTNLMISVSLDGFSGASSSASAGFSFPSPTGRYVAFISRATNLVPGATVSAQKLYLRDVPGGYTRAVFHDKPFITPSFNAARHQISSNERYLFFLSEHNYDPTVTKTDSAFELFRVPLFAPEITHLLTNQLRADGLAGESYRLQFSGDLGSWTNGATTNADPQGNVTIPLAPPPGAVRLFYRLEWQIESSEVKTRSRAP